jgi:hypothetical protein
MIFLVDEFGEEYSVFYKKKPATLLGYRLDVSNDRKHGF